MRLAVLDSMRGWAAFIVLITHFLCAFRPGAVFGGVDRGCGDTLLSMPPFNLAISAYAAVSFFFVLSGFVLSCSFVIKGVWGKRLVASIVKRPLRLGVVVFTSMLLASLLQRYDLFYNVAYDAAAGNEQDTFFSYFWREDLSLSSLILTDSWELFENGAKYNGPLWTIRYELYGSYLVYLLLMFQSTRWRWFIYLLSLIILRGSLYQGFVFGLLIAEYYVWRNADSGISALQRSKASSFVLITLGLMLASYPHYVKPPAPVPHLYRWWPDISTIIGGGYSMVGGCILLLGVVVHPNSSNWLSDPLSKFMGRVSYSFYALHWLIIGSISAASMIVLMNYLPYSVAFLLCAALTIILLSFLSYIMTILVDDNSIRVSNRLGQVVESFYSSISDRLAAIRCKKTKLYLSIVVLCTLQAGTCFSDKSPLVVFIFAGQSNMRGEHADRDMLPMNLTNMQSNLFFNGKEWVPLGPGVEVSGFGPELSFAKAVSEGIGREVGVIKVAENASTLAREWSTISSGRLFESMIRMVKESALQREVEVAGMIWVQGESDSREYMSAINYGSFMALLIRETRRLLISPNMIFMAARINPPQDEFPYVMGVRRAIEDCRQPFYAYVDCDDIEKGKDDVHYTGRGLVELGYRFANAYLSLRAR